MELYLLKSKQVPVQIFGRNPNDIVSVVEYHRKQAEQDGVLSRPDLADWIRTVPAIDEIPKVEKGRINFHVGMINCKPNEADPNADFFSEYMQVTPDFLVAVSPESVLYFEMQRRQLPQSKRGSLYKFEVPGGLFASLNFIPQDVMEAILKYDLTPHIERGMRARKKIEQIAAGHPNLAVALKRAE